MTLRQRMAAAGSVIWRSLPFVRALCGIGGIGLMAYGAWLHYRPLGFLVGGALLAADAVFSGAKKKR